MMLLRHDLLLVRTDPLAVTQLSWSGRTESRLSGETTRRNTSILITARSDSTRKMGVFKLATATSFLVMSGAMLYAQASGRLFPGLFLGTFFAISILVIAGISVRTRRATLVGRSRPLFLYVLPIIVIAVTYRLFVLMFPASIVGVDPPGYLIAIRQIAQSENIYSLGIYFYSNAPLGFAFPAMLEMVTDDITRLVLAVYPLVLGTLVPVVVAVLTAKMTDTDSAQKAILAAGLAAVATVSVRFAHWPIPQSLALAYWTVLVLFAIRYLGEQSKRFFVLILLVLAPYLFTHKLPLLIIFVVVFAYATVTWSISRVGVRTQEHATPHKHGFLLAGMLGVFLVVQWAFITEYLQVVILRTTTLLSTDAVVISPPLVSEPPTAAVPIDPSPVGIIIRNSHWLFLLLAGGVAWVVMAYRRLANPAVRFLLACTAIPVALLVLSIVGGGLVPEKRLISFVEPVLIPLVAIVFGSSLARLSTPDISLSGQTVSNASPRSLLTVVVVLLLSLTFIFSPVAGPDFPGDARMYTTAEEVNAKSFGYEHVDGTVHSDWFMTVSGPPVCAIPADEVTCIPESDVDRTRLQYQSIGYPLLNANLTAQEYDHIVYRTDVTYYRTNLGSWRLLWEPERNLDASYNRVYANGGANLYDRVGTNSAADGVNDDTA